MNILSSFSLKQCYARLGIFYICLALLSCAPASDRASGGSGFSSLADCEELYKPVFIASYYDIITTAPRTCSNCHSNPGTSHEIAIPDPDVAFDNFLLMSSNSPGFGKAEDARLLLKGRIVDPAHYSSGDLSYTALVNSFETDWTDVVSSYNSCVNSF